MVGQNQSANFPSSGEDFDSSDGEPRLDRRVGRVLALDVGKKRIGLALSDALGITAQGLQTYQRVRIREDIEWFAALVEEHAIVEFLIGLPLHMSGDESRQAGHTREFGDRLIARTGLPVVYWDERWTSIEAGRVLRSSGIGIEKRAQAVDRLSAVLLLESYLDYRQHAAQEQDPQEWESE